MLQEILYRYVGMRRPDLAVEVYDLFVGLSSVVFPVTLADTDRAREFVREGAPASMRDLVHAAVMLNNDLTSIASFDGGFDHVPGVQRFPWTAQSHPRRRAVKDVRDQDDTRGQEAPVDIEIDPVEGDDIPEALGQAADADGRVSVRLHTASRHGTDDRAYRRGG